jgi:hypothetical protein
MRPYACALRREAEGQRDVERLQRCISVAVGSGLESVLFARGGPHLDSTGHPLQKAQIQDLTPSTEKEDVWL